jgi:hypothetical protein
MAGSLCQTAKSALCTVMIPEISTLARSALLTFTVTTRRLQKQWASGFFWMKFA